MFGHRVLSVGQCMVDHGGISRLLKQVPAEAVTADTAAEAVRRMRQELPIPRPSRPPTWSTSPPPSAEPHAPSRECQLITRCAPDGTPR